MPVGGGKDSIVTLECLRRGGEPLVLFSLGDAEPIAACIAAAKAAVHQGPSPAGRRPLRAQRGRRAERHVPITGILSAIALASAVMCRVQCGRDVQRAFRQRPNISIDGVEVNHQYSKSFEFEQDFAQYVERFISPNMRYFSLLRPLSEIEIARRFSKYPAYFGVFRSCNTAFRQARETRGRHWCCDCPKCRFRFSGAFAVRRKSRNLIENFGSNLLDDEAQRDGFAELCGLRANKPFECVGETSESAGVMSYLADHPDWRADRVVRRLNEEFPALRHKGSAEFRALLGGSAPAPGAGAVFWRHARCVRLTSATPRVAMWGLGREGERPSLSCATTIRNCLC